MSATRRVGARFSAVVAPAATQTKELAISGSGVLKAITELENQLELDPELSKRT